MESRVHSANIVVFDLYLFSLYFFHGNGSIESIVQYTLGTKK